MDRKKVIKELHDARRYLEDKEWSDRGASPHIDAINDALALLKEDCHNCKLECLLQRYDQLKEKYEKLLKEQEKPNGKCVNECECWDSAYERGKQDALKEQEEQKRKWLQTIADTQLAISPTGYESEDELAKRGWEWNGLQMAWEIIAGEERSEHPRLVRCKDCKHHGEWSCAVCINELFETAGDWFCADGEAGEANDKLFQEDIWHK